MVAHVQNLLGVDAAEADRLRAHYWRQYGTTLAGLMAEHRIDPDAYLYDVHDIDLSVLTPDPDLAAAIAALPGRKIIHTNADALYASRVLGQRNLPVFEAIYGIQEVDYHPKPDARAYAAVIGAHGFDPATAAMCGYAEVKVPLGPDGRLEPAAVAWQPMLILLAIASLVVGNLAAGRTSRIVVSCRRAVASATTSAPTPCW